jgi:hypothetical protein
MNSLRSFVRQSISLGSNAFQEKDKADKRQHEGSSHEGSKISAEDNASSSGLTDVEVVEDQRRQGEFLDCRIEISSVSKCARRSKCASETSRHVVLVHGMKSAISREGLHRLESIVVCWIDN